MSVGPYSKRPQSVRRLEERLRSGLVGKVVPFAEAVPDPVLGDTRHSAVDIAKYLEEATYTLSQRDSRVGRVEAEPNGLRSFPDLRLTYRNGFKQALEVKSWKTSRAFDVAKMKPLHESLLEKDPKYFTAWYVVWSYTREADGYHIKDLELSRIWEICGWTKTLEVTNHCKADVGYTALRPGLAESFDTPLDFLFATVGTTVADPSVQVKMFGQGVELLQELSLYSDVDKLLLKNRVRGAGAMRDGRHDFLFSF